MSGITVDRLTLEYNLDDDGNVRYADVIVTIITSSPEGCHTERYRRFHFRPSEGESDGNKAVIRQMAQFIDKACRQLNCSCYQLNEDGTQHQIYPTV